MFSELYFSSNSLLSTASCSIAALCASTRSTQPCIPPGSLNRVPASAGGKGGNVISAGWQVTLCDPIWHVSSRSGVATLRTAIHLLLTYLLQNVLHCVLSWFPARQPCRRRPSWVIVRLWSWLSSVALARNRNSSSREYIVGIWTVISSAWTAANIKQIYPYNDIIPSTCRHFPYIGATIHL